MNLELFVAKRIFFSNNGENRGSRPAIRVATAGISLGLAVMILSIAIVLGFKKQVRDIVTGFGSDIQVSVFDNNYSYETLPITVNDSLLGGIRSIPDVKHIQRYATKLGILKTADDFNGIVLKGVGTDFDWSFFEKCMIEGEILSLTDTTTTNDVMISLNIANRMHLKLGDSFLTYFIAEENIYQRKFTIKGIYNTNFVEYDKMFIVGDIRHVQKLNEWERNQASGLEVAIKDFDRLDDVWQEVYDVVGNRADQDGLFYYPKTIRMVQPQVLEWLDVIDMNVWIILILLVAVAGFTMISGLLIIILERINMIGVFKALGASNRSIRKIFLWLSFFMIGRGMLIGNIIGITICLVQAHYHIIPLDAENYYLPYVPVNFNIWHVVLLNIGTLIITVLLMIAPSYLVTRIAPSKAIRFE